MKNIILIIIAFIATNGLAQNMDMSRKTNAIGFSANTTKINGFKNVNKSAGLAAHFNIGITPKWFIENQVAYSRINYYEDELSDTAQYNVTEKRTNALMWTYFSSISIGRNFLNVEYFKANGQLGIALQQTSKKYPYQADKYVFYPYKNDFQWAIPASVNLYYKLSQSYNIRFRYQASIPLVTKNISTQIGIGIERLL